MNDKNETISLSIEDRLRIATDSAKRGAFGEARTQLEALLKIEPHHELATGMLAAIHAELKNFVRAAEYYSQALKINPVNPLARIQLGVVQLELRRPQAALDTLNHGLAIRAYGASEFLAHYHSGVALLQLGRHSDARIAFEQSRQFMPTTHALYPHLIATLMKLEHPSPKTNA